MPKKRRNMSVRDGRQVKQQGMALRATAYRYVPNRGEADPFSGEPFQGFDALKLAAELLNSPDLMPWRNKANYHGGGGQVRSLPNDFTLFREHVVGEVIQSGNLAGVHASKINEGTIAGARLPNNVVTGNGPGGALNYGQIANTPDLSKFLTSIPKAYVTKRELENALKGYAKKNHKHGGG